MKRPNTCHCESATYISGVRKKRKYLRFVSSDYKRKTSEERRQKNYFNNRRYTKIFVEKAC